MNAKDKWIFGSAWPDLLLLHATPLALLALTFAYGSTGTFLRTSYAFFAFVVLDIGHVYGTLWRTYFNPAERRRHPWTYLCVPLLFLAFFSTAIQIRSAGRYLWEFVFLVQTWHTVRQYYGISRWYQAINGASRPGSDFFLYALWGIPLAAGAFQFGFSQGDKHSTHHLHYIRLSPVLWTFVALYVVTLAAWIRYEIAQWRQAREPNRILSVAGPAALYGSVFFNTATLPFVNALVVSHGLSYLALVHLSLKKTQSPLGKSWGRAVGLLVITSLIAYGMSSLVDFTLASPPGILLGVLAVTHLSAFFSHVYFDTYLWKRSHPEAAQIYA